ncbi:hypothetical protein F4820DRAFT_463672 [Hypoxylon rubiginosum]|uniref:Uncharacterized protein n=1 Tax=Hypoxylon rubiginosum TaxID=110542 RepID=A0ACB9YT26_9PEZI|nr:hypothetical protein F4820DRAFT_463672 [Hypoxylon rubiginosum]
MAEPQPSLSRTLEAVTWLLTTVAVIVVGLRFYTRAIIVRRVGWDDWMMLLSLGLMITDSVFVQISVQHGLGNSQWTLLEEDAITAIKWDYLAQPPAIIGPALGRISFAMLLLNLIGTHKARRIPLHVIIVSQFIANTLVFVLILAQCKPIESLWDYRITGVCWGLDSQSKIGFFQGALNAATDLTLAIFPTIFVWGLQMKLSQKVSLAVLMGLGVFAMVGSIMKTVYLPSVGKRENYTYNTAPLIIWWMVEGYLVIIATSIVTLRPLFKKRTKHSGASGNAHGIRTIGSSTPKGYISTTDPAADDFPLTYMGTETGMGQPSVRAGYDSSNSHELTERNGEHNIRKTVSISVNVSGNRRS